MKNESKDKMKKVLWGVLEQHAFLMLDEEDSVSEEVSVPYIEVKMSFLCNDSTGVFKLVIPESVSNEVEVNLTGVELQNGEFDGGKEMLNIIGANVLTELYGSNVKMNLSIPFCESFDLSKLGDTYSRPSAVMISLEGLPIILDMEMGAVYDE